MLARSRSGPSPATLIALVGLFFALGGASLAEPVARSAARLITGKQIKDGSIAKQDLSASAQRQLRGQRGAPGAQGIQGSPGSRGADGPVGPSGSAGRDGADGADGQDGAPGAGLDWRGEWESDAGYSPLDVVRYAGEAYLATASTSGAPPSSSEDWDLMVARGGQGPKGNAGVFAGQFQSPNGQFSITVANAGITLTGPGGTATIDAGKLALQSPISTQITGTVVQLNGACSPLARVGDATTAAQSPGHTHTIASGSPTVSSC